MLVSTKPPKCKHCGKRTDALKQLLHSDCIEPWLADHRKKQALKARQEQMAKAKVERAKTKARRRELETIPELIKLADKAFAAFIRERDRQAGYPCISSGKPLDWSGNQVDAGHYRSRGAASALRYNEDNCHAQSKFENRHRAGNAVDYRILLIERIGLARVEALETNNEPHKWQRDELRGIVATYRAKLKALHPPGRKRRERNIRTPWRLRRSLEGDASIPAPCLECSRGSRNHGR